MGYTTQAGVDLLGFGPSAISELARSYAQSHRELDAWERAVRTRGLATLRGHRLGDDDLERRWIIGRIMGHGALSAAEYAATFGRTLRGAYARELAALEPAAADGLVAIDPDGSLALPPLGRVLVRSVAMAFDAYLPEQQRSGARLFSKAV
jgi:oxygen-independent coproporphyrinogen-3 oxidase